MSVETQEQDWIIPDTVVEPLQKAANVLYVLFVIQFIGGLYMDWVTPGEVIIPALSVISKPYPNSGLFLSAILTVILGYLAGKSADIIEEKNKVKFDQTQEWTVDIKGLAAENEG